MLMKSASTKFRLTVLPNSNDIVPVRNQLLELDLTNTSVSGTVDATATTGKGYTVTTTATTTQQQHRQLRQLHRQHLVTNE